MLRQRLPEALEIEEIKQAVIPYGDVIKEGEIISGELVFPVYSFGLGAKGARVPHIAFISGVHGLERVGTNIAISYLKTVLELISWDKSFRFLLDRCRLLFLPLVNPVGMFHRTRSNGRGVDLMRNAPVDTQEAPLLSLVSGHRLSEKLPWYRGAEGTPMEQEAQILCNFVRRELFHAPLSLTLDMHSGFGLIDRIWFPFAYTKRPFERIDLMFSLKNRLNRSLPNHNYLMEPQSHYYVTHGDLWDFLYLEHLKEKERGIFLPLTLEMGSWLWIKKNPRQIFNALGIFNPMIPHRLQRTLRRHLSLLDCLHRLVASYENWIDPQTLAEKNLKEKALKYWFKDMLPTD